jgi:hypothetical protein
VAQQRYRSRQRERLQEKEVKLVELTEQLTALTTEKVCDFPTSLPFPRAVQQLTGPPFCVCASHEHSKISQD